MKRRIILISAILIYIGSLVFYFYDYSFLSKNWYDYIRFTLLILSNIFLFLSCLFFIHFKKNEKIKNLEERLKMWSTLSYHVSKVGDEAINNLPVGIIVYGSEDNSVKWINNYVYQYFGDITNKDLLAVNKDFSLENRNKYDEINTFNISNKEKVFEVKHNKTYNAFYLFDVTNMDKLEKKYESKIPAIAIISFDNYETGLLGLDVSRQSSLQGEYLSMIVDWAENHSSLVKNLRDNQLLISFYRENLNNMIDNNFDIIDQVRELSKINNVKITISIGVASWDVSLEELGRYAQSALELAQRRGGDQAVVNIQNKKISYFGARTGAQTTYSRVNTRYNAQTIFEHIQKSENVLIMGHNQSDTDAFASMLCMLKIVSSVEKEKAKVVFEHEKLDNTVQKISNVLFEKEPDLKKYFITPDKSLELITENTLLIILDTQSPLLVSHKKVLEKSKNIIIIDHHRAKDQDQGFKPLFEVVETSASSTIEIILELMNFIETKVIVTPIEASVMYSGLVVDTNNFTSQQTSSITFEVAGRLRELDADIDLVKLWLRKDYDRIMAISKLLQNMEIYKDKYAFIISENILNDHVLLAQAANEALEVSGISASFALARQENNKIKVSARSLSDINVQTIMEEIGGGGHMTIAAAEVANTNSTHIVNKIKQILDLEYDIEGEKMKIILTEDLKGKGNKNDVIEVASGYATYLINNKKAVMATEEHLDKLNKKIKEKKEAEAKEYELNLKLKEEIETKQVTVEVKTGQDGKLFGGVTTKQIVEAFEEQNKIMLDRKKIELQSEINQVGIYTCQVSLKKDIKATFNVHVIAKQ